jgi:hypothetical protein
MPIISPWRALLRSAISAVALNISAALAGDVVPPNHSDGAVVSGFGHRKHETCAEQSHERVRALLDGTPWPRSENPPAARNRHCG